ncbi:MAG: hypothetical protein P9X24_09930 [Candidatus Hatepunaea meridiana]|nr:hypothetical protein [Candidatus Hatepunaea meridiana]
MRSKFLMVSQIFPNDDNGTLKHADLLYSVYRERSDILSQDESDKIEAPSY